MAEKKEVLRGVYTWGEEKLIAQSETYAGKREWLSHYFDTNGMYPLEYRDITPDVIRNYANGVGDPNPLYNSVEYAKGSRWGRMVAPPMLINKVAATFGQPHRLVDPRTIRVVEILNAGTTYYFYKPIMEGTKFKVKDVWYTDFQDKTRRDGSGDRNFLSTADRVYIDQYDEIVVVVKRRRMYLYGAPIKEGEPFPPRRTGPRYKRYEYTQEELDYIDGIIDAEEIRGANPRYWEDVNEGDEMKAVAFHGLTDWDQAGMFNQLEIPRNTTIWDHSDRMEVKDDTISSGWSRRLTNWWRDPILKPGISQSPAQVHINDDVAQWAGSAIAYTMGGETDLMLCRLVTNWMGDDAFLKRFDTQNRLSNPNGDATICKGKVIRKYMEDGEYLVDLAVWAENIRGFIRSPANCTMALPSREQDKNAYRELKAGGLYKDTVKKADI
ncbi:MaoC family dehydratase N-terminal domain-containing protein [Chloroflexota bacterium]